MTTKDELIICRCEGVNLGQIQDAIRRSRAQTVNQVKKLTRAGMGLCQGRTCAGSVETVLASEKMVPAGTEPFKSRPPVRGIAVGILADGADRFDEPPGPVQLKATSKQASDSISQKSEKE